MIAYTSCVGAIAAIPYVAITAICLTGPQSSARGWRPDPMWWLIVMWGLVMFTYFAVNLWVSGLHSYAGV